MRKSIVLVLIITISLSSYSQVELPIDKDNKVSYTDVVNDTTKSTSEAFNAAKEFFATNGRFSGEETKKLIDNGNKKLIYSGVNVYKGGTMGCVRVFEYSFDAIVQFREGRYKYEITNFVYLHYNHTGTTQQVYGMKDQGACKSSGTLEEFLECNRCKGELKKLFDFIDSDAKAFIEEMKKYISEYEEDEW